MATPVIMPRQGQSVESCIFTEWHAKAGDTVQQGDLLFSYETDKAAFEGEAPEDGTLLATFAEPGDEIPVLQNIAVIGKEGEPVDEFRPGKSEKGAAVGEPEKMSEAATPESTEKTREAGGKEKTLETKTGPDTGTETERGAGTAARTGPEADTGAVKISPRARKKAEQFKLNYTGIEGSGPYGRIIEKDILEHARNAPRATPLARAISSKDHLEMPPAGTGAGGKITAADLRRSSGVVFTDDYEEKKISNIRKIIAENMHASLQNTAQLTLHSSADARKIKAARKVYKKRLEEEGGTNVTINDMVCYATVQAILKNAELNAHFLGDSIRYFKNVHLGFAVDTSRGLMVPTVKNANHLKIEGLSAQIKELAQKAQEGKIDPELLKGATFTVTNLGAFGIEMFTPVLNPPQIGILGVNNITMQPASLEDGSFGFIPRIGLSLTFDHRGIDGAPAAAFLREIAREIENFEIE